MVRRWDNVLADELGTFLCSSIPMLRRAFPFKNRPARKIILRHLGKHRAKIDLPVT